MTDTTTRERLLFDRLQAAASADVPEAVDLWPSIERRLAEPDSGSKRAPRSRSRFRRLALAGITIAVLGFAVVVGVLPALTGGSPVALAADLARNSPEVAALLRGDIEMVTVVEIVDGAATVVVQDSTGQDITVKVDVKRRIVSAVYHGPQLSDELTLKALRVLRGDPRTRELLEQGASLGRITPILVGSVKVDPQTSETSETSETWAQVPVQLGDATWEAYIDLPQGKIDQLVAPDGSQVPPR
ncbi:MAG: hypothetical protein MUO35_05555 [Anaerolineales bacterium]|nr:hypothetical protein [Anaerolineales bacterium]